MRQTDSKAIKIRGEAVSIKHEHHPLGLLPEELIEEIGKRIVHRMAMGLSDFSGDDFSRIFAESIGGTDLSSPLGVADVTWNGCAWSVKTVKNSKPHEFWVNAKGNKVRKRVRLISGRNSPVYSADISDPLLDVNATGNVVLDIYNKRVEAARNKHSDLRMIVLVRNYISREYAIYERPINIIPAAEYRWILNKNGNLEGWIGEARHAFTWQPHGSQFTIIEDIPKSTVRWKIMHKPPSLPMKGVLELINYSKDWIEEAEIID